MTYTSVSPKYQVVIPKVVRERLQVKPGQKLIVYERGGIIHLIPTVPLKKLRGMLKGSGVTLEGLRDKSDRPLQVSSLISIHKT
ncbi:MAG: AbrB/MazE/SpoVT family DNA-binding domain-containing protein [Deltaproteobacteria bacterium]|nr:AbrB/MazE/SpoVT family DNA-binding domain-containing protein [Deltaproteobacteria bacterium]MBI2501437.1 AbrB/MazE/SpoVT family DNA-binding domain-containing protein [Deltaproteobacteria bacterium]